MSPGDQAPPPIRVVVILSSLGAVFGVAMAEVWSLWEEEGMGVREEGRERRTCNEPASSLQCPSARSPKTTFALQRYM